MTHTAVPFGPLPCRPLVASLGLLFITLILTLLLGGCGKPSEEKAPSAAGNASLTAVTPPTAPTAVPDATPSEIPSISKNSMPAPGGYRVVDTFNVGDNIYVRSMALERAKGSLWVGTSIGVIEVDVNTRNLRRTYTRNEGLANEYVFGMFVDQDNNKWFGTNGGGMSRYNDGQWKTYFPMHGLADYWVYSFTEQKDKTLWVGTWAGLTRFNPKTETFINYVKELVNEWVYGLGVDSKDRIWVGTEGGINRYDGKTWAVWTHKDGLGAPNNENLPISDNTGLGTRSRHDLSVLTQGSPTYNPNYVFSLIVAKDDSVWAGTWGGGASHFDGSTWTNYTVKDGLAGNVVYSVTQDDSGAIWFGTDGGLSRFDGKAWIKFTRDEGLIDNNIYALATTPNNEIWAGSRSGVMLLAKVN